MKCGWVFVPLCCDKRCCTLNCKYCQNVLALPLKKNSKGGTFCVVLFFVCTGGDVRYFSFKGYLVLFIRLRALSVLLKVTVLEGQYCGRGWIFCRSCCGLMASMASIPFDSSLKHGIGSLLLACASSSSQVLGELLRDSGFLQQVWPCSCNRDGREEEKTVSDLKIRSTPL